MMETQSVHDTFIIRIRHEQEYLQWNGSVQHINSGTAAAIHTPADLLDFIRTHSSGPGLGNDPADEDRSGQLAVPHSRQIKPTGLK
ncbi:MAG: hypothetical protein FJZ96_12705 [Chloroflexi bacterium]|nr:hypothetical protein [Chloroflexota bacterium]